MNKIRFQVRDAFIALAIAVSTFAAASIQPSAPYNTLSQSVVRLTNLSADRGGTGFTIRTVNGQTFLVSNWHVCQDSDKGFMLATRDGEFQIKVKVLKVSTAHDLCLLEAVPGKDLRLGHPAKELQELFTLGHPWLGKQTPGEGRLVSEHMEFLMFGFGDGCPPGMIFTMTTSGKGCLGQLPLTDTTLPVYPGDSGSPVTDRYGNVVGVVNSTWGPDNHGAMINVKYLRNLLNE